MQYNTKFFVESKIFTYLTIFNYRIALCILTSAPGGSVEVIGGGNGGGSNPDPDCEEGEICGDGDDVVDGDGGVDIGGGNGGVSNPEPDIVCEEGEICSDGDDIVEGGGGVECDDGEICGDGDGEGDGDAGDEAGSGGQVAGELLIGCIPIVSVFQC